MSTELFEPGFLEAAEALAKKEITAQELVQALLTRAEALEPELNALTWRDSETALAEARAADAAQAFCNDMAEVRNAIAEILAADDITAAAKAAAPKIPAMMPKRSELAGVLREAMVDGVAETVANKED